MTTKEVKTMVRIAPTIAHAIKSAAAMEGIPAYRMLEGILIAWLAQNRPALFDAMRNDRRAREALPGIDFDLDVDLNLDDRE